jgi:hypothetical protein
VSTLYSLRIKPNWAAEFLPAWQDVTGTLDLDQLPSITVSAERGDVPLVATASDLSLTVSNAEADWDEIFDARKIIGQLPPVAGEKVRAPAAHFGEILLCRRATDLDIWQVMFYGFVDPISPLFDRNMRTCAFTAYAPGKLLEAGNAERVHRFHAFVLARPFVIPVEATGRGAVQHPVSPAGDVTLAAESSWWRLAGGASVPVIPLQGGDRFKVVRAVVSGGWTEGMLTVEIVNTEFVIAQVGAVGPDLYFQTTKPVDDDVLTLTGFTAGMELLNPWYRSRDWKALIDGSDGNTNCLANETNEALAVLGVSDHVNFLVGAPPALPLMTVARQLFAQPIYQPDVIPGCAGVSYGRFGASPILLHQIYDALGQSPVGAKPDILAPDSTMGGAFPKAATNVFSPASITGYFGGPDDDKPVQLLSSSVNDQVAGSGSPDYAAEDIPVAGQSVHAFGLLEAGGVGYDSTHWCRAPSSYRSGSEPKYYYRIYAIGRIDFISGIGVGIEITRFSTSDSGAAWTIEATATNLATTALLPGGSYTPTPATSQSSRPSLKVFELDASHFLYVWVNPWPPKVFDILGAPVLVGAAGGAFCYESATDDVDPATLMAATAFIPSGGADSPTLLSSAVHWPGATVFFSDRADRSGVDVWVYSAGPTWTKGTFVDETGRGLGPNLLAADWINAVTDSSRSPVRLYVMVGKALYVMHVVLTGTELHIVFWQAVQIDQINYDVNVEAGSMTSVKNPNAVAWLTCPVAQAAVAGEPDYPSAGEALIVGTQNAVYVVADTATNIVDVADFEGLSVASALAKLVVLRGYFVLSGADKDFVGNPAAYVPSPIVTFYARLETASRKGVLDLVALTEQIQATTWLQNYQGVSVANSKLEVGPAFSSDLLTNLDGVAFTIQKPRNAVSVALEINTPFVMTVSFLEALANFYAIEFVIPRLGAQVVVRSPYAHDLRNSDGDRIVILPGSLVRYLLTPRDDVNSPVERDGRVLTIDYGLGDALDTLAVA